MEVIHRISAVAPKYNVIMTLLLQKGYPKTVVHKEMYRKRCYFRRILNNIHFLLDFFIESCRFDLPLTSILTWQRTDEESSARRFASFTVFVWIEGDDGACSMSGLDAGAVSQNSCDFPHVIQYEFSHGTQ